MRCWSLLLPTACAAPATPDGDDPAVDTEVVDTAAGFVPDEVVLATGAVDDPEIAEPSGRVVWLDRATRELWTATLDPATGALSPADGRGSRVDAGVAPFTRGENGGEWMSTDRGDEVLYVREREGAFELTAAALEAGAWVPAALPGPVSAYAAYGSTVPGDPDPRVVAWTVLPPHTRLATRLARQDGPPRLLPDGTYFAAWIAGVPTLVGLTGLGEDGELYVLDPDADTPEVVADGLAGGPRAWGLHAPELDATVVVAEVRDGPGLPRRLAAWRREGQAWTPWSTVEAPDGGHLTNSSVFTCGGHTYAAFQAFADGATALGDPSEVWVAALDPDRPLLRRVSSPAAPGRRGVEVWTGGARCWVYFLDGTGPDTTFRRCATGLGR